MGGDGRGVSFNEAPAIPPGKPLLLMLTNAGAGMLQ